jgi:hypothetical protein
MVSLRNRGRHPFTSSLTHLTEGAIQSIRLPVPFSLWTSHVSITASLREKDDDFHSPPPLLATWRKERYDPVTLQSLSASGPLMLVLRPASEKKRTTFIHLLLRSPDGRSDMIHLPSSPFQPLYLSCYCYGQPQRKRGQLSFTSFSAHHLAEGAIRSIRLPVPFSLWTSQVSVTARFGEKEEYFNSPPPSPHLA